jgi:hypothetical protein
MEEVYVCISEYDESYGVGNTLKQAYENYLEEGPNKTDVNELLFIKGQKIKVEHSLKEI